MTTITNTDIDIALRQNANGVYDIRVADNGDLETVRSFDTAIILSLFLDRRASASEVPRGSGRRGWVGNVILDNDDFEFGSKIWLYEQSRLTESIRINFEDAIREAVQWFIDDAHASSINITSRLIAESTGLEFTLTFFITPDVVETRQFIFWTNTGQFTEV